MGYILPVTQYEYQNYQKRMEENESSPHYIERPHKVKMDTRTKLNRHQHHKKRKYRKSKTGRDKMIKQQTLLIQQQPGKGTYVNEKV